MVSNGERPPYIRDLAPIIEKPNYSGPYMEDIEGPRDEDVHHRRRRKERNPLGKNDRSLKE